MQQQNQQRMAAFPQQHQQRALPIVDKVRVALEESNNTYIQTFKSIHQIESEIEQTKIHIETIPAKIFNKGCCYDMVLDRDFVMELGIVLDFKRKTMEWDGSTITMHEYPKDYQPTMFATKCFIERN